MTPREFSPGVVQRRLSSMRDLLADLRTADEVSVERLEGDRMLRHAVERILSQLVDIAVSINSHASSSILGRAPADYRTSFTLAVEAGLIDEDLAQRLRPSVGLRNVLAHEYVDVDLAVVATGIPRARAEYGDYVRSVAAWLDDAG